MPNKTFEKPEKEVTAFVWTKNGWAREKKTISVGPHHTIENDYIVKSNTELDPLIEVQETVSFDSPGLHLDKLPNILRIIGENDSEWHYHGKNLFKIVNPINAVKAIDDFTKEEIGSWGVDQADADNEEMENIPKSTRRFLEQCGYLKPINELEETDLFCELDGGSTVNNTPYGIREDKNIESIFSLNTGEVFDETENEDSEEFYNEDSLEAKSPTATCIAPGLPEHIIHKLEEIQKEYLSYEEQIKDEDKLLVIQREYEKALHRIVEPYIYLSINSSLCGNGYTAPRREHVYINIGKESDISIAAAERQKLFSHLFGRAAACDSMDCLYGIVKLDEREFIDGAKNPNYKKRHRIGGFVGEIRSRYNHDKEIVNSWSLTNRTLSDGTIIESSFSLARNEFIAEWRAKNKECDEEFLRIAVWITFDREAKNIPPVYKDGKIVKSSVHYKDSKWRQERTQAFKDLFLTKKQWDAIYAMVGIVKHRIDLAKTSDEVRDETIKQIQEDFARIDSLRDLRDFIAFCHARKIIDGTVIPSLLDKISFKDEISFDRNCQKKKLFLAKELKRTKELNQKILSKKETTLPEIILSCLDPDCDCMAIGNPIWFEIEEGKGLLGVYCQDGCGKVVWDIKYKEELVLRSFEECTKEK